MRWLHAVLAGLAICLLAIAAWADNSAHPTGTFTPNHALIATTPSGSPYADGGGAAGSDKHGQGYISEIGITNTGTPLCINDALTSGAYHQLCFGANSLGGMLISYTAKNGATPLPCQINLNGVTTPCSVSVTGMAMVADKVTMAVTSTATYPTGVWRRDYASGVGAPPLFYFPETGTCVSNSLINDGGSCIDSSDGNSWVAHFPNGDIDVRQFGAIPDNSTAADTAFAAAIAYAKATGLCAYAPNVNPGYKFTGALTVTSQCFKGDHFGGTRISRTSQTGANTTLNFPSDTNGLVFQMPTQFYVGNFSLTGSAQQSTVSTHTSGISFNGQIVDGLVENIWMQNFVECRDMNGPSGRVDWRDIYCNNQDFYPNIVNDFPDRCVIYESSGGSSIPAEVEDGGECRATGWQNFFTYDGDGSRVAFTASMPGGDQRLTNAATASGRVLHFGSTLPTIGQTVGAYVIDETASVIPRGTTIASATSTSITLSADVTGGGVGSGDSIDFIPAPGSSQPPLWRADGIKAMVGDPTTLIGGQVILNGTLDNCSQYTLWDISAAGTATSGGTQIYCASKTLTTTKDSTDATVTAGGTSDIPTPPGAAPYPIRITAQVGLDPGTKITAVNTGTNHITLSKPALSSQTGLAATLTLDAVATAGTPGFSRSCQNTNACGALIAVRFNAAPGVGTGNVNIGWNDPTGNVAYDARHISDYLKINSHFTGGYEFGLYHIGDADGGVWFAPDYVELLNQFASIEPNSQASGDYLEFHRSTNLPVTTNWYISASTGPVTACVNQQCNDYNGANTGAGTVPASFAPAFHCNTGSVAGYTLQLGSYSVRGTTSAATYGIPGQQVTMTARIQASGVGTCSGQTTVDVPVTSFATMQQTLSGMDDTSKVPLVVELNNSSNRASVFKADGTNVDPTHIVVITGTYQ